MDGRATILRVRRLGNELKQLRKKPLPYADAYPVDDEMRTWHFVIFGPEDSDYFGGEYFGRIELPANYPLGPPNFYMLTPSGRFLINQKICLSNSSYHSSEWTPSWSLSNILAGMISIMLDSFENGISHIHKPSAEKQSHAQNSHRYNESHHPEIVAEIGKIKEHRRRMAEKKKLKKMNKELKKAENQNSEDVHTKSKGLNGRSDVAITIPTKQQLHRRRQQVVQLDLEVMAGIAKVQLLSPKS